MKSCNYALLTNLLILRVEIVVWTRAGVAIQRDARVNDTVHRSGSKLMCSSLQENIAQIINSSDIHIRYLLLAYYVASLS